MHPLKEILGLFNKRKEGCIVCGGKPLTREHIFPKWSFVEFDIPNKVMKSRSQVKVIAGDQFGNEREEFSGSIGQMRNLQMKDFVVKCVCEKCNSGWMSDMEMKAKNVFIDLLGGKTMESLTVEEAFDLSRWCIIKAILTLQALTFPVEFEPSIFKMLSNDIIPEGFIVEAVKTEHKNFNFHASPINGVDPITIDRETMSMAEDHSFMLVLHFGNYLFRTSYLRTSLPVQRYQLVQQLLLLYPYHGRLPFISGKIKHIDKGNDPASSIVNILAAEMALIDRYDIEGMYFESELTTEPVS